MHLNEREHIKEDDEIRKEIKKKPARVLVAEFNDAGDFVGKVVCNEKEVPKNTTKNIPDLSKVRKPRWDKNKKVWVEGLPNEKSK